MNNDKKAKIVVGIFMLFLVFPSLTFWYLKQYFDTSNYENKQLESMPILDYTNFLEYPMLYESYFTDNVPFKNEFVKLNNLIDINVFGMLDNSNVVLGKDDWLFFKGENGKAINEYIAKSLYTEAELKTLLKSVINYRDDIKSYTGADFVLMLIPDKEHVYSEYLPDSIKALSSYKKIDQIYDYITSNSDVKVSYPLNNLLELKKTNPVYYKYDTHWNLIGAYAGTVSLLETLDYEHSFNPTFSKDIQVAGDLSTMLALKDILVKDYAYKITNYLDDIIVNKVSEVGDLNHELVKFTSNSNRDKNLYFIGDSFRNSMKDLVPKQFSKTSFVHREFVYREDLILEKPDIVVYEIIERNHTTLFNLKF